MKYCKILLPAALLFILLPCTKAEEQPLVIVDNQIIARETVSDDAFSSSVIYFLLFSPLLYRQEIGGQSVDRYILAQEVKVLPGNRSAEVTLREGIRFHDGRSFTAPDVPPLVTALRQKLVERYGERYRKLTVEVLDSRRFRISNALPVHDMKWLLTHIYAQKPGDKERLNGTGPFRFGRWLEKGGVELEANDNYLEGRPTLRKIVYLHEAEEKKRLSKMLKREADLMILLSPETARFLENDRRFHVGRLPSDDNTALLFNSRSPLFSDRRIRKAVSLALDRSALIEKGREGAGLAPFYLQSQNQAYRPKEALILLKEAGWRYEAEERFLKKKGERLRFTLYYANDYEIDWKVPYLIAQQLYEVGIEASLMPINGDLMMKKALASMENEAFLSLVGTDKHALFRSWHSEGGSNLSHLSNGEADRLIEMLLETTDSGEEAPLRHRLGKILEEEAPAALLYRDAMLTAANRRFEGAEEFVGDIYHVYKIKDWRLR